LKIQSQGKESNNDFDNCFNQSFVEKYVDIKTKKGKIIGKVLVQFSRDVNLWKEIIARRKKKINKNEDEILICTDNKSKRKRDNCLNNNDFLKFGDDSNKNEKNDIFFNKDQNDNLIKIDSGCTKSNTTNICYEKIDNIGNNIEMESDDSDDNDSEYENEETDEKITSVEFPVNYNESFGLNVVEKEFFDIKNDVNLVNTDSLCILLFKFFHHYSLTFDWENDTACVREGAVISKKAFNWDLKEDVSIFNGEKKFKNNDENSNTEFVLENSAEKKSIWGNDYIPISKTLDNLLSSNKTENILSESNRIYKLNPMFKDSKIHFLSIHGLFYIN
jgi:hypothetical protein